MKKVFIFIIAALIVFAGAATWCAYKKKGESALPTKTLINQVTYICHAGKTIKASFYKGEEIEVQPGEMPIPTGSVELILSDGGILDLPQTISASGARYANSDESFIFWEKGGTALILENGAEGSYTGCVVPLYHPASE